MGKLTALARRRQMPAVSQAKAGELVGVSRGMFNHYENGVYDVPDRVRRILAELWDAPELLDGIERIQIGGCSSDRHDSRRRRVASKHLGTCKHAR